MNWADVRQSIDFVSDIVSILTFLGLGYVGIKISRFIRKFGWPNVKERIRQFLMLP